MSAQRCRHPDCVIKLRANGVDGYCTIHAAEKYQEIIEIVKGEPKADARYQVSRASEAPTPKTITFDFLYRFLGDLRRIEPPLGCPFTRGRNTALDDAIQKLKVIQKEAERLAA